MMQSLKTEYRPASRGAPAIRTDQATSGISTRAQWNLFYLVLAIFDLLMLGAAFRVAYMLRFDLYIPFFQMDVIPDISFYQRTAYLMALVWWGAFIVVGLYKKENLLGGPQEYALVFRASTTATVMVMVASFFNLEFGIARGWLLLSWFLSFLFVTISRFSLRRLAYVSRNFGFFYRNNFLF